MIKHALFGAALLVLVPGLVRAQRGADTLPRSHVFPALGLHVGTPQKVSAALGVVVGQEWHKNGHDHSRNIALFAEPGIGAGRLSVAFMDHGYGTFGSGYGLAASFIRTWKDPWTVQPNVSYVGGDLILWPILFVGPRIGLFHVVGKSNVSDKWFVSIDFGIGY